MKHFIVEIFLIALFIINIRYLNSKDNGYDGNTLETLIFLKKPVHSSPDTFTYRLKGFNLNDTLLYHYMGELFGGGVVFYVDSTKRHGYICSISDIRDPASYQLYKRQDPRPLLGRTDSALIINMVFAVDNPKLAKELCAEYTNPNFGTGIFSDWSLPTFDELKLLYQVKDEINKVLENINTTVTDLLDKCYWSSTKIYDEVIGDIWQYDFKEGSPVPWNLNRRSIPGRYYVRAVRAY
jgi:hypothetical protein